VSRARKRVRAGRPRVQVSAVARTRLLSDLVQAIQSRDKAALVNLLAEDATWTSDGGGKTKAAKKVVRGRDRIARFALGVFRRSLSRFEFRTVTVNNESGLALRFDGRLFSVLSIRTDGVRILDIYNIMNPEKLRAVNFDEPH
jgi:RNA polymerase sigma-70 factor (ECF subfamily)